MYCLRFIKWFKKKKKSSGGTERIPYSHSLTKSLRSEVIVPMFVESEACSIGLWWLQEKEDIENLGCIPVYYGCLTNYQKCGGLKQSNIFLCTSGGLRSGCHWVSLKAVNEDFHCLFQLLVAPGHFSAYSHMFAPLSMVVGSTLIIQDDLTSQSLT